MNCINHTGLSAGSTVQIDRDGRPSLVAVVKATFALPFDGGPAALHQQPQPLLDADVFWGEPGLSAPRREMDFAARKPFCDVLLSGSAHAPERGAKRLPVGLRVGAMTKRFQAVGDRVWQAGLLGTRASPPETFRTLPLDYGRAYGGGWRRSETEWIGFPANPVGRGHYDKMPRHQLDGRPLPNLEAWGQEILHPDEAHPALSLGPVGRNWQPRQGFAGRYDDDWLARRYPLLPEDFDERYFQAAAADQWIKPPRGGEEVVLINLADHARAGGERVAFTLPQLALAVRVHPRRGATRIMQPMVDTLFIEPDEERFSVVWRVGYPLRQSPHEVGAIEIGTAPFRGKPVVIALEDFKANLYPQEQPS